MPLKFLKSPPGAMRLLKSLSQRPSIAATAATKLTSSELRAAPERALPAGPEPAAPEVSAPHAVFVLGADQAGSDKALATAKPAGWRALTRDGRAAEVRSRKGKWQVSGLVEGPPVTATEAALAWAGKQPELSSKQYEVRLLRVPGLHVHALWLVPGSGADFFVVMHAAPPPFEAETLYSRGQFLDLLRTARNEFLEHEDHTRPEGAPAIPKRGQVSDAVRPKESR